MNAESSVQSDKNLTNLTKAWLEEKVKPSATVRDTSGQEYAYYGTSLDEGDVSLLVSEDANGQKQTLIHKYNGLPVTQENPIVLEVYYQSEASMDFDVSLYDYDVEWGQKWVDDIWNG